MLLRSFRCNLTTSPVGRQRLWAGHARAPHSARQICRFWSPSLTANRPSEPDWVNEIKHYNYRLIQCSAATAFR